MAVGERRTTVGVQLQFDRLGEHASTVDAWMAKRYPHIGFVAHAQPGLTVGMRVPHPEETFQSWHARLIAAAAPMDVALEVTAECFTDLALPVADLVGLHVTD